jgi:glycogen phosphorylase
MSFHIRPIHEFLVRPALPDALPRLNELAYNVLWSWEPVIRGLFRRLDTNLWRECNYNPVLMLSRVSRATLLHAAADPRYVALYNMACQRYDAHVQSSRPASDGKLIAYFSAEYGLSECLPIYSGGLGVLSGDHLKSCSDCDLPLVAVGLLYQEGYFRQVLNPDGWQQERYPVNDFYTMPCTQVRDAQGQNLKVSVKLPTGDVAIRVWKMEVGRVMLYLLDTNIPDNVLPQDRGITGRLYGGDTDTRMRQEIVLGIGGVRALHALGLDPPLFHMNEGHSAFLALERIRLLITGHGLNFEEALEASRASNVFTTHTPVPAGIDLFDAGIMYHYFGAYCSELGIDFDQLMGLGRRNPDNREERFSMPVLALKTCAHRNTVSKLHLIVSQEMWHDLWPQLPAWEVPISSITNGVHLTSWLNGDLAALYDQYLQPDWRERYNEPGIWEQVQEIPDEELLEMHRRRKRRLVNFVRERQRFAALRRQASAVEVHHTEDLLDPNAFTIGFARRFATYKRATLLFRDVERLKRILCNKEMPVQVVIAGKAHPRDNEGKNYIRDIVQFTRDRDFARQVVFIEDYDLKVGRELVQGVDLWLNTPKRGQEACGTSGMKAGMNGALNLSILDGWYDEAYEYSGGWAIGEREPYSEEQDSLHASEVYYLLENEIVPLFYDRRDQIPREWIKRVKQSLMGLTPQFDSRRMVAEYDSQCYEPAYADALRMRENHYQAAREAASWNQRVRQVWDQVRFVETGPPPSRSILSENPVPVHAAIDLAGLQPNEVRVEVVMGQVGTDGALEDTEVVVLPPVSQNGSVAVFEKEIIPERTGRLGYALRISPNHYDDPLTRPACSLLKWSQ